MLSCEIESDPLKETEGNGPQQMKQYFLALLSLCHDLVFLDEVKHGHKRASMHPHTEHFNHESSLLVADDALWEENS